MEKVKLNRHFISDIFFYQEGPGVRKWQFKDSGVKLINVGNINNGKIDLSSTKINISEEEAYGKYSHFLIDEGDLLIACSGIVVENFHNKIAFIKKEHLPLCLNTSTMRFKELPEKKGDLNFLKYFLQTNDFKSQLRKLITGSAQLNFGPSHIRKIEIPLPPLATQQRIAAILDQSDAIVQNNRAIVQKYDALTQSLFLEMFGDPVKNEKGWEKNNCRNILKVIGGGVFKSSDYVKNGIPLIRIGSVNKGYFDDRETVFIPETYIKTHKKYLVYPNDLLITLTGTVGKNDYGNVFKLGNDYEKYYLNQRVAKFEINETKIDSVFFEFYLKQNEIKKLLTSVSRGVRQANISNEDIYNLEIILPSINLQNLFAERVAVIEAQKQKAQLELAKSEELFASLLQRAFKGELN